MMQEFARSREGQTFFCTTLPNLVEALNRLASVVEESNRLRTVEIEKGPKTKIGRDRIHLEARDYDHLKTVAETGHKIKIIQALRATQDMRLKTAKEFVERYFPPTVRGKSVPGDVEGFMLNFERIE